MIISFLVVQASKPNAGNHAAALPSVMKSRRRSKLSGALKEFNEISHSDAMAPAYTPMVSHYQAIFRCYVSVLQDAQSAAQWAEDLGTADLP